MAKSGWTHEEDRALHDLIEKHGACNWSLISLGIPGRSSKSCRLRWCNQLNPGVKKGPFTEEEDQTILRAQGVHGNKWAIISRELPGRTDNQVKNRYNSTLRRLSLSCKDQNSDGTRIGHRKTNTEDSDTEDESNSAGSEKPNSLSGKKRNSNAILGNSAEEIHKRLRGVAASIFGDKEPNHQDEQRVVYESTLGELMKHWMQIRREHEERNRPKSMVVPRFVCDVDDLKKTSSSASVISGLMKPKVPASSTSSSGGIPTPQPYSPTARCSSPHAPVASKLFNPALAEQILNSVGGQLQQSGSEQSQQLAAVHAHAMQKQIMFDEMRRQQEQSASIVAAAQSAMAQVQHQQNALSAAVSSGLNALAASAPRAAPSSSLAGASSSPSSILSPLRLHTAKHLGLHAGAGDHQPASSSSPSYRQSGTPTEGNNGKKTESMFFPMTTESARSTLDRLAQFVHNNAGSPRSASPLGGEALQQYSAGLQFLVNSGKKSQILAHAAGNGALSQPGTPPVNDGASNIFSGYNSDSPLSAHNMSPRNWPHSPRVFERAGCTPSGMEQFMSNSPRVSEASGSRPITDMIMGRKSQERARPSNLGRNISTASPKAVALSFSQLENRDKNRDNNIPGHSSKTPARSEASLNLSLDSPRVSMAGERRDLNRMAET